MTHRIGTGHSEPIGVVLAGGLGRRLGGAKAMAELNGRPLISYPVAAMKAVLDEVAVLSKPDTELPVLSGVALWTEPALPTHPVAGIVRALELAHGRAVLACAVDLPLVTPELIALLVRADPAGAGAVLASLEGAVQPLLGCYQARAAGPLARALARGPDRPVRELIGEIGPRLIEIDDPDALFNVNLPADLRRAAAMIERRDQRQPNVKS